MEILALDAACNVISNLQLDRRMPCLLLNLYGEIQRVAKIAHFTLRVWTRITYKKAYSKSRVQHRASHPVIHAAALEGHSRLCLCHKCVLLSGKYSAIVMSSTSWGKLISLWTGLSSWRTRWSPVPPVCEKLRPSCWYCTPGTASRTS